MVASVIVAGFSGTRKPLHHLLRNLFERRSASAAVAFNWILKESISPKVGCRVKNSVKDAMKVLVLDPLIVSLVKELYELSAEYEGKREPKKLEVLGNVLTNFDNGRS